MHLGYLSNAHVGIVPAGCNMESEFVCQPSYDCPATAQFLLTVVNKDANMANELQQSILTLIPEVKKKKSKIIILHWFMYKLFAV